MKVLIVSMKFTYGSSNYGGVNKMLLWLGNSLQQRGCNITFCTIYDIVRSDRINTSIKSIELAVKYKDNILMRYAQLMTVVMHKLKKVLREHYDYVVCFDGLAFFPLLVLRQFIDFKYVVSERADPHYNSSLVIRLIRYLYRYVDVLICQTDGAKSCFCGKIQERTIIIPNPISIPECQWEYRANAYKIAYVGRLHVYQKRQDVLLNALPYILERFPDVILNIYGDGPDMAYLESLVRELRIQESVIFHGASMNVNRQLLENSVYVLSSDFEGIPNSLLEAMALGLPVVSTNCSPGGASLVIDHKVNGVLVECGNVKQLADAIIYVLEDANRATMLGKHARESMAKYSPDNILNIWMGVFIC